MRQDFTEEEYRQIEAVSLAPTPVPRYRLTTSLGEMSHAFGMGHGHQDHDRAHREIVEAFVSFVEKRVTTPVKK